MRGIVAEILEIDEAAVRGPSRLREDLGMDSLGSLELLSTISEQLRIHLEMEDAMGIETFDDACAFVRRHLEAQATGAGEAARACS
jgi:acyl carrier protein